MSWQGVNDLSAHPATTGPNTGPNANPVTAAGWASQTIVLNTLGMLTNRENRFAAPRFSDDYFTLVEGAAPTYTVSYGTGPDGFFDDLNNDKVPDLYPTLYPNVLNTGLVLAPNYLNFYQANTAPFSLGLLAFPYIFPGAYSVPQALSADQFGWIHSPTPVVNDTAGNTYRFDQFGHQPQALTYLNNINHNPLDLGDNLAILTRIRPRLAFFPLRMCRRPGGDFPPGAKHFPSTGKIRPARSTTARTSVHSASPTALLPARPAPASFPLPTTGRVFRGCHTH